MLPPENQGSFSRAGSQTLRSWGDGSPPSRSPTQRTKKPLLAQNTSTPSAPDRLPELSGTAAAASMHEREITRERLSPSAAHALAHLRGMRRTRHVSAATPTRYRNAERHPARLAATATERGRRSISPTDEATGAQSPKGRLHDQHSDPDDARQVPTWTIAMPSTAPVSITTDTHASQGLFQICALKAPSAAPLLLKTAIHPAGTVKPWLDRHPQESSVGPAKLSTTRPSVTWLGAEQDAGRLNMHHKGVFAGLGQRLNHRADQQAQQIPAFKGIFVDPGARPRIHTSVSGVLVSMPPTCSAVASGCGESWRLSPHAHERDLVRTAWNGGARQNIHNGRWSAEPTVTSCSRAGLVSGTTPQTRQSEKAWTGEAYSESSGTRSRLGQNGRSQSAALSNDSGLGVWPTPATASKSPFATSLVGGSLPSLQRDGFRSKMGKQLDNMARLSKDPAVHTHGDYARGRREPCAHGKMPSTQVKLSFNPLGVVRQHLLEIRWKDFEEAGKKLLPGTSHPSDPAFFDQTAAVNAGEMETPGDDEELQTSPVPLEMRPAESVLLDQSSSGYRRTTKAAMKSRAPTQSSPNGNPGKSKADIGMTADLSKSAVAAERI